MINEHKLISIFCEIDEFCKELDKNMSQLQLTGPIKGQRGPASCEIMVIQVLFQMVEHLWVSFWA